MGQHLTRPVIGVNADFIAGSKVNRAHMRLNVGYFEAVLQAGGLPVVMPPYGKEADIAAFLETVDGFVLSGGLDLDPRRSGQPTHSSVQPMAERREESDRILVRMLLKRRMPMLGDRRRHAPDQRGLRRHPVPASARGPAAGHAALRSFVSGAAPSCRAAADRHAHG